MEVLPYKLQLSNAWDEFCLHDSRAWFWHTSQWMNYCLESSFNLKSTNCSFVIAEDGNLLAIIPLFIESRIDQKENQITYGGAATPMYLIREDLAEQTQKKCRRLIEATIRQITIVHNVQRYNIALAFMEQSNQSQMFYKELLLNSFINTTTFTSLLDLNREESEIFTKFIANHIILGA
jgi:hypothetical protein